MKRVKLTHGTATVDENANPELIRALNRMSELASNFKPMNMKQQLKPFIDRVYDGGVHQITIDIVQNAVEELSDDSTKDEIASVAYQVENLIEVMNPDFKAEVEILKGISSVFDTWVNSL